LIIAAMITAPNRIGQQGVLERRGTDFLGLQIGVRDLNVMPMVNAT
jgi:hypothetical protein